ncbi:MAG: tRNA (adenosine(37)-N6)-threonylcarbamoyltransferase complex dimerization subunit type 1 TsaB [Rhodocyclaceae bacterium]|nr:tRNA (adenosine(37)-N6)-threonylcarbamoyltransferase complex dimerization subunit type 1 TsaB [Rhodocyclaceae bacterium]MBX3668415.1 tRNA (adenosine(37)-N6)-threonylcarbamoyltransferase complex dimerization subunit type 1 TsaB [Rhodocyclaceae bacterium]
MNVLALESSATTISAALLSGQRMYQRSAVAPDAASTVLLPWVGELAAEAGLDLAELDAVAAGVGPGAFTGLRLAVAVAQGLCVALDRPAVAIGSLEALAWASGADKVYVCVDARQGEVYCAAYRRIAAELRVDIEAVVCPPEHAPLPEGEHWTGVGSGFASAAARLPAALEARLDRVDANAVPDASVVAELAALRLPGAAIDPAALAPLYVRDKVALTTAERLARGGRS